MLELAGKDFKASTLTMQKDIKNMFSRSAQIRIFSRETETTKRKETEMTELKNIILEIRNSLHGLNNRMEMIQERISELENIPIKLPNMRDNVKRIVKK